MGIEEDGLSDESEQAPGLELTGEEWLTDIAEYFGGIDNRPRQANEFTVRDIAQQYNISESGAQKQVFFLYREGKLARRACVISGKSAYLYRRAG
jgi:hypothetical protein